MDSAKQHTHKPTISILMGIYNCATTLDEAISSIMAQTFTDWEMILCDDGSTDNTVQVAIKYVTALPDKFKLLRNPHNVGLNQTLNNCLAVAQGEYIARMDGDDLCVPTRFAKELEILKSHPEIDIVSSDMAFFDNNGTWGHTDMKETPQPKDFCNGTQFCHAACLVRKKAYDTVGGYSVDNKLLRVEDYHLWVKMYEHGYRGINIKEPLYLMRDDRNAQVRRKFKYRLNESYVRAYAVRHLKLSKLNYIYCLRPILVGLLPAFIYKALHRMRNR